MAMPQFPADGAAFPAALDAAAIARLRAGVRLMALRRLGDPAGADDAAQETVSRLLAALHQRREPMDSLGAFAHGIARHVIADMLRAQARSAGPGPLAFAADPRLSCDALGLAVAADEHARVHAALASLPGGDREILRLSFFEGLTPAEIAARSGEPAERVRKRKSRALERLREVFAGGHAPVPAPTMQQAAAPAPGAST